MDQDISAKETPQKWVTKPFQAIFFAQRKHNWRLQVLRAVEIIETKHHDEMRHCV